MHLLYSTLKPAFNVHRCITDSMDSRNCLYATYTSGMLTHYYIIGIIILRALIVSLNIRSSVHVEIVINITYSNVIIGSLIHSIHLQMVSSSNLDLDSLYLSSLATCQMDTECMNYDSKKIICRYTYYTIRITCVFSMC